MALQLHVLQLLHLLQQRVVAVLELARSRALFVQCLFSRDDTRLPVAGFVFSGRARCCSRVERRLEGAEAQGQAVLLRLADGREGARRDELAARLLRAGQHRLARGLDGELVALAEADRLRQRAHAALHRLQLRAGGG